MSAVITEKEEDDDHLVEKPLCENNSRLCAETPTLLADLFIEVSYTLYLCGINSIVQKITTLVLKCTGNTPKLIQRRKEDTKISGIDT